MNQRLVAVCVVAALLLAVANAWTSTLDKQKNYNNMKLIKVQVSNEKALADLLKYLGPEVDIWSNDGVPVVGGDNEILVTSQQYQQLNYWSSNPRLSATANEEFSAATVKKFEVIHHNIQDLIEKQFMENRAASNDDFFKKYQSYEDIMQFTKGLNQLYPEITSLFTVGSSWEKRDIVGLKISVPGNSSRVAVLYDGLQHAREWIAAAVVAYAMRETLTRYEQKEDRIVALLSKIDIYFIPIVNPDGYHFTMASGGDRLWRKNRRDNGHGVYGVDLNRNWPVGYGIGSSTSPSSTVYRGPNALSEPESSSYDKWLTANMDKIRGAIDFHSYSQLVLRPWDYTEKTSADEYNLKTLGAAMQTAIANKHGVHYQNIRGIELYAAGGALNDNFYGSYKFFGYTIELRDTGHYGFLLPPDQIIPTSEENYDAILVLAEYVAQHFGK